MSVAITADQAKRRRTCPQCKRLRFIPRNLDPYCTPSCKREAEQAEQRRLRLVITVPLEGITDGPGLAALLVNQVIPDLEGVAGSVTAEIGELRPGQYGWTSDPEDHGVRVHWAVKQDNPAG